MTTLQTTLSAVGGIVIALITLLGVVITVRSNRGSKKIDAAQHLIEQLQLALRDEREERRDGQLGFEGRISRLEIRDYAWDDYVSRLRAHINDEKPPPPPEYPPELMI